MNEATFFKNISAYRRKMRIVGLFQLVFLVAVIVGDFLLIVLMERYFHYRKNDPILVLPIVLFFILLLINAIFADWINQKVARDTGMVCPSCDKVVRGRAIPIIIATHNCIHCGREFYHL